ncbi:hypothetical protein ACW9YV_27765 (plasmid) [Paraburkholderia strydomiana]
MEIKILKTHHEHGAGWVHAGETRTVADERGKELIRAGLAEEAKAAKTAEQTEAKKAPVAENKKRAEPANKAAK